MLRKDELREVQMATISTQHSEKCPRCGSWLVSLEWDERVSPREVQDLWHCCKCQNEFTTVEASDEKEPSAAEITAPFFTSLVVE
jgi:DNA-directed RNA polymerase subunit RPC12/RpoP